MRKQHGAGRFLPSRAGSRRGLRFIGAANRRVRRRDREGRGQIVSRPHVITADRVRAVVEQGTELPYQAKLGSAGSGVQPRRAALKLEVEPQITRHGHVILDLDVSKDCVGKQSAGGPAINTKHLQMRVKAEGRRHGGNRRDIFQR